MEDGFSDPKGLVKIAREKLLGYVLILNRFHFPKYGFMRSIDSIFLHAIYVVMGA